MSSGQILFASGRVIIRGKAKGPVLFSFDSLSFSRLEPRSGRITDRRVDVFGETIRGKILVFPYHRGSTTSPAVFLETCRLGAGPLAILVFESDPLLTFSGLLAKTFYGITIPIIDKVDSKIFKKLEPNIFLKVDGHRGKIFKI